MDVDDVEDRLRCCCCCPPKANKSYDPLLDWVADDNPLNCDDSPVDLMCELLRIIPLLELAWRFIRIAGMVVALYTNGVGISFDESMIEASTSIQFYDCCWHGSILWILFVADPLGVVDLNALISTNPRTTWWNDWMRTYSNVSWMWWDEGW